MPPVKNNRNNPAVGIGAVLTGLFLFAIQDVAIKFFSDEYSLLQIFVIRGTVAVMLCALMVALAAGRAGFVIQSPGLALSKGLLAFLSYLAYYLAMATLPLADVVAIVFTAPILVTLMSVGLLGERVGIHRWMAVVVGFAGVWWIVGPSGRIADIAVSLAALAALTYAMSSVIARYIGPEDSPLTVTFYFSVINLLGGVAVTLLVWYFDGSLHGSHPSIQFLTRPWSFEEPLHVGIMVVLGVNGMFGFYLLNKAYLSAHASTVAPYEYSYLIWAVLFGYLFWAEVPSSETLAGVALLVAANLYILRRELLQRRFQGLPSAEPVVLTNADYGAQASPHAAYVETTAAFEYQPPVEETPITAHCEVPKETV